MRVSFDIDTRAVDRALGQMAEVPGDAMQDAFNELHGRIPVRSGNLRRRTRYHRGRLQVRAAAPYATEVLRDGRSRQYSGDWGRDFVNRVVAAARRLVGRINRA